MDTEARPGSGTSSDTGRHAAQSTKASRKWTRTEVECLLQAIGTLGDISDGVINWGDVARSVPTRTGKQCREKYRNDLRPDISKSAWSGQEEYVVCRVHCQVGNQWADIAKFLPGRAENGIKNHYNATLRSKAAPRPSLLWVYGKQVLANGGATSVDVFDRACEVYSRMGHAEPLQRYAAEDDSLRVGPGPRTGGGGGTGGGVRQTPVRVAAARRPRKKHRRGHSTSEDSAESEEEAEQDLSYSSASEAEEVAAASRGRGAALRAGGSGGDVGDGRGKCEGASPLPLRRGGDAGGVGLLGAAQGVGGPVAARGSPAERQHHQAVRHEHVGLAPSKMAGPAAVAVGPVPATRQACIEAASAAAVVVVTSTVAPGGWAAAGAAALQGEGRDDLKGRGGSGAEKQQQQLPVQPDGGAAPCVLGPAAGGTEVRDQQQQSGEQSQRPPSLCLPVAEEDAALDRDGGEGCLVAAAAAGGSDTPPLLAPTDRLETAFIDMPDGLELRKLLADINCCDGAAAMAPKLPQDACARPGACGQGCSACGLQDGSSAVPSTEQAPGSWTCAHARAYDLHHQDTQAPGPMRRPYGSLVEALLLLLQSQPHLAVSGPTGCALIHQPQTRQGGQLELHSLLPYLQLQAAAAGALHAPGLATPHHLRQQPQQLEPLIGMDPFSTVWGQRALYDTDPAHSAHGLASGRASALKQRAAAAALSPYGIAPLSYMSSPPVKMVPVSQGGVGV